MARSAAALSDNLIHRVNVGDSLTRTTARHPDRVAIVDGERSLTYAEFNTTVNKVAHGLLAAGYGRGDALAIASGNSADFLVAYYACAKIGVVGVPINLGWRSEEVAYVLGHSAARGIVVETQLVAAMSEAITKVSDVADVIVTPGTGGEYQEEPADRRWTTLAALGTGVPDIEPDQYVEDRDPITYLYTSGTTSFPKGVVGNHTAIYLESITMALECRFGEDDRFVAMLPMFHTAQLNCHCTAAVMVGATIHVRRAFDAGALLEQIEREKITQIFGLPMMYRAMLDQPDIGSRDLSSLRRACYAMAPMPDAQLRRCLEVFDCDFYLLFGQTEMSPTATIFRPEHQLSHTGAVGTAAINVRVGIMSKDGELLPPGETGEIVYRGPHAMTGYLKDEEATEKAFAYGWFHSGDVGWVDDDGVLWFSDRYKDVIKTGGENVASIEVEKAIYAAAPDTVAEAVVVGLRHDRWAEAITAIVVPKDGQTVVEEDLKAALRTHLDPYKIPKAVLTVDQMPRTSTGKIQKNVLRDRFADHYAE